MQVTRWRQPCRTHYEGRCIKQQSSSLSKSRTTTTPASDTRPALALVTCIENVRNYASFGSWVLEARSSDATLNTIRACTGAPTQFRFRSSRGLSCLLFWIDRLGLLALPTIYRLPQPFFTPPASSIYPYVYRIIRIVFR